MRVYYKRSLLFLSKLFLFIAIQQPVLAQNLVVGRDDVLRQLQLEDKLDIKNSLCARPFFTNPRITSDSIHQLLDANSPLVKRGKLIAGKYGQFEVLPLTLDNQFNSHHPYGWNLTDMIEARGWQSVVGMGIYASMGMVSVQLNPEFAYAANPNFEHNANYGAATNGTYKHLFPGQSSIRLNAGAVSVGISTESIWWGPGINNSLLMSNNAPGFLHLTLNSRRPLKTPIGSFEWQFVSGKLYEDTTVLLENKNLTTTYYNPLTYGGDGYSGPYDPSKKWRYFNGITITYQPKWMPGLFLGLSRIAYAYNDSLSNGDPSFLKTYLPTVFGVFRQNYAYGLNLPSGSKRYKQMASVHLRYVFPKAHAELYGEYGWGDNQYNIRDFVLNVDHSRAFITGIRKMSPLAGKRWLDWQFEITQMSQSPSYQVRTAGNWYGYQGGYTNQSRILGAGVGMGSDVQTATVSWVDGLTRLGIKLERLQHDPNDYPVFWTDKSFSLLGQKRFNRLLLNVELQGILSNNYLWEQGNNAFNFRGVIKCAYRW
jgi:hypothetical protein